MLVLICLFVIELLVVITIERRCEARRSRRIISRRLAQPNQALAGRLEARKLAAQADYWDQIWAGRDR